MAEKRKKILYIITKSNFGGAQRYVYDLATNLDKDRYEIAVALGGNGMLIEYLNKAGIKTIPIKHLERDISLKKELGSFFEISNILREENPDVLHVNSSKAGGIGAFLGRLHDIPKIIYTAHGWAFNEDRNIISRFVVGFFHWLTIIFSRITICVSAALKEQMKWPLVSKKMVIVRNGRKRPTFKTRDEAREHIVAAFPLLSAMRSDVWITTIAELHPVKQHERMIEAMRELVKTYPTLRHIIIGDGEKRNGLEALISKYELGSNVFLIGHVNEASEYLKAFDIFVLPSRSEALAYVLIEAGYAALPVIASNVGGIPEIIEHDKTGMLISQNGSEELVSTVSTLLEDRERAHKMGEKLENSMDRFSIERMVHETTSYY